MHRISRGAHSPRLLTLAFVLSAAADIRILSSGSSTVGGFPDFFAR
jgi:hypothetical protein